MGPDAEGKADHATGLTTWHVDAMTDTAMEAFLAVDDDELSETPPCPKSTFV